MVIDYGESESTKFSFRFFSKCLMIDIDDRVEIIGKINIFKYKSSV